MFQFFVVDDDAHRVIHQINGCDRLWILWVVATPRLYQRSEEDVADEYAKETSLHTS